MKRKELYEVVKNLKLSRKTLEKLFFKLDNKLCEKDEEIIDRLMEGRILTHAERLEEERIKRKKWRKKKFI